MHAGLLRAICLTGLRSVRLIFCAVRQALHQKRNFWYHWVTELKWEHFRSSTNYTWTNFCWKPCNPFLSVNRAPVIQAFLCILFESDDVGIVCHHRIQGKLVRVCNVFLRHFQIAIATLQRIADFSCGRTHLQYILHAFMIETPKCWQAYSLSFYGLALCTLCNRHIRKISTRWHVRVPRRS